MNQDLKIFYGLTRHTRAGVLNWLETLPAETFIREHDAFAFGSLRNIYAHVAACYLSWVGTVGLGREEAEVRVRDVNELREAFSAVDVTVTEALETFDALDQPFTWTFSSGHTMTSTRRWLILHPITHEFHHKGQALALARVLGHPHPGNPDTDLVEP